MCAFTARSIARISFSVSLEKWAFRFTADNLPPLLRQILMNRLAARSGSSTIGSMRKHDRGDWNDEPVGSEPGAGQHVVNEQSMNTSVSIRERMDENEAKRCHGRRHDWVDLRSMQAIDGC